MCEIVCAMNYIKQQKQKMLKPNAPPNAQKDLHDNKVWEETKYPGYYATVGSGGKEPAGTCWNREELYRNRFRFQRIESSE
ncbi:unnamed protein product [Adineta ricciae]|uniref:Uncharacterized protein n=1 Tax=Adineta ricciae TaxID=249248 RepID=A0A816DHE3_ADIRI|nr:unnamed protein product [Adineta ricciae]CAF1636457.1 unnamed protein product [Adineta ricciae]